MTSYAELERQRKRARPLYLELRALGFELYAHEDPEEPTGYALEVRGILYEADKDRVMRHIEELEPSLLRILMMGEWDPDYRAIREEGMVT